MNTCDAPAGPMDHIARALSTSTSLWPAYRAPEQAQGAGSHGNRLSKTERIRRLLRQGRPMTASRIALELELERTDLVGALLKGDLARGSVRFEGGRYRWCESFDQALASELAQAAAVLRRHGYEVRRKSHSRRAAPKADEP